MFGHVALVMLSQKPSLFDWPLAVASPASEQELVGSAVASAPPFTPLSRRTGGARRAGIFIVATEADQVSTKSSPPSRLMTRADEEVRQARNGVMSCVPAKAGHHNPQPCVVRGRLPQASEGRGVGVPASR